MKKICIFALILSASAWSGCATTSDIERVEHKVASTNSELGAVRTNLEAHDRQARQDSARAREDMERLSADIDALRADMETVKRNQANLGSAMNTMAGGELMDFTGQMDELRHEVETSKLKLDAFKAALLQKLADIEVALSEMRQAGAAAGALADRSIPSAAAGGGEYGADAGQGAPPVSDPLQLYQAAYLDYTKGNYELALMGFKDYLSSFPDGEFAGNAQYWIGESLYSLGQYKEALIEFEKVLGSYPDSPKAPGAMLKKGFCFEALGRADDAKAAYEKVIGAYPSSEAARLAAEKLKPRARGQVPERR